MTDNIDARTNKMEVSICITLDFRFGKPRFTYSQLRWCHSCGFNSKNVYDVQSRHELTNHSKTRKRVTCSLCTYSCASENKLQIHMAVHKIPFVKWDPNPASTFPDMSKELMDLQKTIKEINRLIAAKSLADKSSTPFLTDNTTGHKYYFLSNCSNLTKR